MYTRIGVPVDLEHSQALEKAIATAAALAGTFGSTIDLVAVTSPSPGPVAHSPEEFGKQLALYAEGCAFRHGVAFTPHARICDDPGAELDRALSLAFHELATDLVVIATHVPGLREYVFSSHAGWLASHTDLSVFVVR